MSVKFKSPGYKIVELDLTSGSRNKLITSKIINPKGIDYVAPPTPPTPPIECGKQFPSGFMFSDVILFNCKFW